MNIIDQYKLYVELADRVSARRANTNKFYITLSSALLAFIVFIVDKKICMEYLDVAMISFSFLGLLLNCLWYINIKSYKQLNSGKFKVIHDMESHLPFSCFKTEWKILENGKNPKLYRGLTRVECFIPIIFAVPYVLLIIYCVLK